MTVKDMVLETVQQLPKDVTLAEVIEELATLAAIERGQAAAAEGRVTPHAEFQQQALQWTTK
ncbi:MAG TPA: hypothetical protein VM165_03565 [Planctomycetaceae bacterium]|nr:hypothetical protein [Planctomycetaceae bacterium]